MTHANLPPFAASEPSAHGLRQDIAFISLFGVIVRIDTSAFRNASYLAELVIDILDLRANDDLDLASCIEHLEHPFNFFQPIEIDFVLVLHDEAQTRDAMECLHDIVRFPDVIEDIPAQLLILHEFPFRCGTALP